MTTQTSQPAAPTYEQAQAHLDDPTTIREIRLFLAWLRSSGMQGYLTFNNESDEGFEDSYELVEEQLRSLFGRDPSKVPTTKEELIRHALLIDFFCLLVEQLCSSHNHLTLLQWRIPRSLTRNALLMLLDHDLEETLSQELGITKEDHTDTKPQTSLAIDGLTDIGGFNP